MTKRTFPFHRCAAIIFCSLAAVATARETIPLNAPWAFMPAEGSETWAQADYDDSNWDRVAVPHSWNAFDGQDGGNDYRRGFGWYRLGFELPPKLQDQRVLLEFDGACKVTDVFLNGKFIGSHTGAFARFRFDVTGAVKVSGRNVLAVRVNNAASQIIPRSGDFTQFGGLYRPVRLLLTAPVHVATLDHASPGVYLEQQSVSAAAARVRAKVKLANDSQRPFSGAIELEVRDAAGKPVTSASQSVHIAAGAGQEVVLPFAVARPRLWDGLADPYLYRVVVKMVRRGVVVDAVEQPLGLRSLAASAQQGFLLNGRPYPLRGVCRHQDRPDKGWAISEADQREDLKLILELGANTVRLAHYQHDQTFYELCDAAGLVVWAEGGFVNEAPVEPTARENAKEQLRELIRQNFNHPAIFCWSIGNETAGHAEDAAMKASESLLTEMAAIVRAEDPARVSVYASDHGTEDPRNFLTGLVAFNKYFGWYGGVYSGMGAFLDKFHAAHPEVPVGISEYGAGASIYQHEDNPPIRIAQARGPWHPEEWQTAYHEANWLQIKDRPWLWGTFVWNMFDFSNDSRAEGDQHGRNDKGLVTYDRQTRKDAFFWYQANWTTNAMVHLVSKRFWERGQRQIEIKAYSNCDAVELKVNGTSLGRFTSPDCRFIWPGVELQPGPNRVEAYGYRADKVVAADWGGWTYRADGAPRPNLPVARQDQEREAKSKAAN